MEESAQSNFWENRPLAEKTLEDLSSLQKEIALFSGWEESLTDAVEIYQIAIVSDDTKTGEALAKDLLSIENELNQKKTELYFNGPYDKSGAILSVYAGAGGNDAEDWARMLKEMYENYLGDKGFKVTVIDEHINDYKGIKQISLEVLGTYAFGVLKKEKGVHRLVRISPFSSAKLRHTSFAYVEVLPSLEEEEMTINPSDITIEAFRSSGPGGQNVQKVESAIRATHKPTGLSVVSQGQRNQNSNKEKALKLLRAKLFDLQERQNAKTLSELKGSKIEIEWGHQIRSYVL
ncbi:MAG: PCRF domain-containing protein, partial [Candidatus Parcubacteria bacterium]|nr:PCRF domain-containing protein [Candidatus Parcubacteria bacterium]